MYLEPGMPNVAVNLSPRLRELRRRQGKTQSDISRYLGVDPSIPSLWEQGKRPVPPQRLVGLAEALEISVDELLAGVSLPADVLHAPLDAVVTPPPTTMLVESLPSDPTPLRPRPIDRAASTVPADAPWDFDSWSISERLTATEDELFEGLWLDPARLDRPSARQVLRDRLCAPDRQLLGDRVPSGGALADRIAEHCAYQPSWDVPVPVAEAIFREVIASELGGLGVAELAAAVAQRVPPDLSVTPEMIRRLAPSLRSVYPVRWIPRVIIAAAPFEPAGAQG
jgi:transcriptional regulator with XRE-family HTH domain